MSIRLLRLVVACVFLNGALMAARADTLEVPSEYATIQAAIDAAVAGDEVVVADGVYTGTGNKNLDFHGKAITVRSASGDPATCIIDCQGSGRGFYFHSGETAAAMVDGFTIRNGNVTSSSPGGATGGGMYCSSSSPTLTNCTISDNTANFGGGMFSYPGSSPALSNCTISGNTASYGGGVYCYPGSSPALSNCTITSNTAPCAGGVLCDGANLTLVNCTLGQNAADYGGGMCSFDSNPTLTNCKISGNTTPFGGGAGLFCAYSSPKLTNCTISGNTAPCGIISPNCVGGGMYCYCSNPTLTNCLIIANTAEDAGGGIYWEISSPTLINCILWGDMPREIDSDTYSSPLVTHCDIQGGYPGTGNIAADPLFLDADGADNDPATWEDNNYHLSYRSPCIDAGDNTAVPLDALDLDGDGDTSERTPLDLDGGSRFVDVPPLGGNGVADPPDYPAIVDIGVYERKLEDCNDNGIPDETDIVLGTSSDCNGNGMPDECEPGGTEDCNSNGIHDLCDIFAGTSLDCNENAVPDDCDIAMGASKDCNGNDAPDDCDIAQGTSADVNGNGIPDECEPLRLFVNCTSGNDVWTGACEAWDGAACGPKRTIQAGIDAALPGRMVTVADGVYTGTANKDLDFRGKAITLRSASGDPATCIIDCQGSGSGFCFHSGEGPGSLIEGLTIRNGFSSGVSCESSSSPTLIDCTIIQNTAAYGGGIYCEFDSSATLTNCTIGYNVADYGGGMCCFDRSNPTLANCILWGDTPQEIYLDCGTPLVTYCDIQGGWTGAGNINLDPRFDAPASGDFHLAANSPCIDAGSDAAIPSGVTTDLDGNPRIVDGDGDGTAIVDMGAYEFSPSLPCGDLDGDYDVDYEDYVILRSALGHASGQPGYSEAADLDGDGVVTLVDYQAWLQCYRQFLGDPFAPPPSPSHKGDLKRAGDAVTIDDLAPSIGVQPDDVTDPARPTPANGDGTADDQDTETFSTPLVGTTPWFPGRLVQTRAGCPATAFS